MRKMTIAILVAVANFSPSAATVPVADELSLIAPAWAEEEEDEEECPAGFEESEDRCTEEERENGCKDIRLDNGKGCVSR